ncbi:SGNH/GDSL hydrolase family protein [Streptomyces zagrosensis]|uniref:Lysophospholipase L1-like esterase n=1 Tax=Streptomyces zagrosensis TaxID=1042984 RepID=A0A7W9QHN0_9ACTN|nr:SGNH/GDSL hydrolase family protein [Streptomyces zagrosensis]MBB5939142.1 lysophospholipase L1-like esterase [Streptomyces zagrosensis]
MSMSRARVARRIATAAAYGGGGIGLLGGATVGLLLTELRLARRVVGGSEDQPPRADGRYGMAFDHDTTAPPLRLGFLGDSTAAGQGVRHAHHTPGALLASGLAAVAERPVELRVVAQPGAQSDDLARQVALLLAAPCHPSTSAPQPALPATGTPTPPTTAADRTPQPADGDRMPPPMSGTPPWRDGPQPPAAWRPDIAVIMIGANDVTHRMPPAKSVRLLATAVRALRATGCDVVVGTCPDLGSVEPVYQPLRWVARRLSRQLAAAQTIAVVEHGGRTVSLGDLLGPEFAAHPTELFGPDNYHPSAEGYMTAAMAILPTLCAALGLWPEEERPDPARREGFLPVAQAAAEAAAEGGTEVAAARGPWAQLFRRRRRLPADSTSATLSG